MILNSSYHLKWEYFMEFKYLNRHGYFLHYLNFLILIPQYPLNDFFKFFIHLSHHLNNNQVLNVVQIPKIIINI